MVADVAPQAVRLLKGHGVVPLLASSLRIGVLDELGWSALDEIYAGLAAEVAARQRRHRSGGVGVTGAWPALILNTSNGPLSSARTVFCCGTPCGCLPPSTTGGRSPCVTSTASCWSAGGRRASSEATGCTAAEVFTVGGEQIPRWGGPRPWEGVCLPLPGGGRATGGKALHAGDTCLPAQRAVICDGTGHWREGRQGTQRVWLEYDLGSGAHGRASLPAFLRSGVRDGARLLTEHWQVLPLQPGVETTPFGTDGLLLPYCYCPCTTVSHSQ